MGHLGEAVARSTFGLDPAQVHHDDVSDPKKNRFSRAADAQDPSLADHAVSAFLHAPIAVAVCEPDGTVIRVNDAMTQLLGYSPQELAGRDLFPLVQEDRIHRAVAACAALRDGSADTVVHDTRFHARDGRLLDVRVTTSAVRASTTAHPHLIMHLEDTTDREDLRRRLQHDVSHDRLTGLGNRGRFLDELGRALPRGQRHEQPVTVLYLDLDDFKDVNDTHGHAAGDQLLAAFGQHVRESVRPEDTAARLGGDEFAVLCEDTTLAEADRIVKRLSAGSWTNALSHLITGLEVAVSIGVATSPDAQGRRLSAEQLLHDADHAMYQAKSIKSATPGPTSLTASGAASGVVSGVVSDLADPSSTSNAPDTPDAPGVKS